MNFEALQRLFIGLSLFLLSIAVSLAESESEQAQQWLERMIQASRSLNYEGNFVYTHGQHLEAMHIIHSGSGENERQRMFSLNGSLREVIISNNKVVCLFPKQQVAFKGSKYKRSPFPISLPKELAELQGHYRFKMLGKDRVANMKTRVVAIQPRDQLRYGYRLWLENETGVVLRSALLDEQGRILEQLMFTNFQIKAEIDPELFAPLRAAPKSAVTEASISEGVSEPAKVSEQVEQSTWTLEALPAGFDRVMHSRFSVASETQPTEHIVLTDGLATVSVFIEPLNGAEPLLQGDSRMGAMNAFGTVIDDHQVMVVGEVPQATVQVIASTLQHSQEQAD